MTWRQEAAAVGLITYPAMQEFLDLHFLRRMEGPTEDEWMAYNLSAFCNGDEIDREFARGYLRSMRARGLVVYERGLWDDDGMPAGAGYRITEAGAARLDEIDPPQKPT